MDSRTYPFDSAPEDWSPFGLMDPTMDGDMSTPEEATAVRQFVQAYNTSVVIGSEEAASRLMSLDETRIPCDGPLDKGERVSWLLWEVAMTMPQYQTAVLVLVDAVRALPEGLGATPKQEFRFGQGQLGDWGMLYKWIEIWDSQWDIRESNIRYAGGALVNNDNLFSGEWVQICAATARYLVLHPPDLEYTWELDRVFGQIRLALEYDTWNYAMPDEVEHHITKLNTYVISLVPFLHIAGPILYRYTDREAIATRFAEAGQESHKHNTRGFWTSVTAYNRPGGREGTRNSRVLPDAVHLWQGDVWLSRPRWDFWKQRLLWISEQVDEVDLLPRTRDEARKLVQLMQQIEAAAAEEGSLTSDIDLKR